MEHSLTPAKKALASSDPVVFGRTYRDFIRKGASDRSLFRLALSADPCLTREIWKDRIARSVESR